MCLLQNQTTPVVLFFMQLHRTSLLQTANSHSQLVLLSAADPRCIILITSSLLCTISAVKQIQKCQWKGTEMWTFLQAWYASQTEKVNVSRDSRNTEDWWDGIPTSKKTNRSILSTSANLSKCVDAKQKLPLCLFSLFPPAIDKLWPVKRGHISEICEILQAKSLLSIV